MKQPFDGEAFLEVEKERLITDGGIVLEEKDYAVDALIDEITMELRLFESDQRHPKRKTV